MSRYALPAHVFICLNGEHFVLLDLKKDRYLALDSAKVAALAGVVQGWPASPHPVTELAAESAESVAQLLIERGLLNANSTGEPVQRRDAAVAPCIEQLVADEYEESVRITWRVLATFIFSFFTATLFVRLLPLERAVRRVAARRSHAGESPLERERARQLLLVFGRLRAYFFTSRDACLFESFALIEFLSHHDILPRWVFAVHARPFAAHCWVQQEGLVLNDTVEHVSGYTPIMVV